MLVKDLLESIPELKIDAAFIKNLIAKKDPLGTNRPREVVATVHLSEDEYNTEDGHAKINKMIDAFDKAITKAFYNELQNQVKGLKLKKGSYVFSRELHNTVDKVWPKAK